ncbi:ribonuclease P protein component [Micromonospora sp. WMMD1102]|uniref:ribonuclease P protein component n=1 Tax=Micromonospora sp. WMMD1102 TaxID=3016105 RepID=UPI0024153991|nr:ribonuclease P protein component [Micromonospora sp. WMMD1102]MDG4790939.1 ribonuclease P protein component [Micromonospora sp. WMMD1102]
MLAAAQRLRRSSDFAAAIRGGRRAGRGSVVVHLDQAGTPASPTPASPATASARTRTASEPVRSTGAGHEPAPARAGFVVSKAVGGAVVRNSVRRRLRHLVRDRLPALPPGSTLVVRALPAAAESSYTRLGADLDAALAAALAPRKSARRSR